MDKSNKGFRYLVKSRAVRVFVLGAVFGFTSYSLANEKEEIRYVYTPEICGKDKLPDPKIAESGKVAYPGQNKKDSDLLLTSPAELSTDKVQLVDLSRSLPNISDLIKYHKEQDPEGFEKFVRLKGANVDVSGFLAGKYNEAGRWSPAQRAFAREFRETRAFVFAVKNRYPNDWENIACRILTPSEIQKTQLTRLKGEKNLDPSFCYEWYEKEGAYSDRGHRSVPISIPERSKSVSRRYSSENNNGLTSGFYGGVNLEVTAQINNVGGGVKCTIEDMELGDSKIKIAHYRDLRNKACLVDRPKVIKGQLLTSASKKDIVEDEVLLSKSQKFFENFQADLKRTVSNAKKANGDDGKPIRMQDFEMDDVAIYRAEKQMDGDKGKYSHFYKADAEDLASPDPEPIQTLNGVDLCRDSVRSVGSEYQMGMGSLATVGDKKQLEVRGSENQQGKMSLSRQFEVLISQKPSAEKTRSSCEVRYRDTVRGQLIEHEYECDKVIWRGGALECKVELSEKFLNANKSDKKNNLARFEKSYYIPVSKIAKRNYGVYVKPDEVEKSTHNEDARCIDISEKLSRLENAQDLKGRAVGTTRGSSHR